MNIIFEQLEVQNFKSIGECITFRYTDFSGLNFIIGTNLDQPGSKNGSGKSVLTVDALVFALFGRTLKNTNNTYISNRYCSKKLETFSKVTFLVDNVRYRSESYIKNSSTVKMLLYKEDLSTDTGWEDLTQCSVIKTRQYIQENILNCTFDVFKTAIIIAASDCLNFYEGMNKNQKRNYIENIFNLNCFGDMYSFAKSDLNEIKKELVYSKDKVINFTTDLDNLKVKSETFNNDINISLKETKQKILESVNKYKLLLNKLDKINESLLVYSNIDSDYDIYTGNLKEYTDKLHKIEQSCLKANCKIDSINISINEFNKLKVMVSQDSIDELYKKYINSNKELEELNKKYILLDNKYNTFNNIENILNENNNLLLEKTKHVNQLNIELNNIKSKIDAIETAKSEVDNIKTVLCKDCTKKIDTKFNYSKKENAIKILTQQIDEYNSKMLLLTNEINDLKNKIKDNNLQISERQKILYDIKVLKNDIKYKEIEVNKLKSEYEDLKNKSQNINMTFDYNKKIESINILNKFITDKTNEKNLLVSSINNIKAKISELEVSIKAKHELKSSLSLINSDLEYTKKDIANLKKIYDDTQLKTTNNPFIELINVTNKKLVDEQDKIEKMNDDYLHIEILKDVFSENGVKRHIIKNLVSVLNSLIQKYLSEIGAEFLVCFDETFDFKFVTLNGECEYSNFSAGEKQRIQIATMLAFRDLILNGKINSNILIIDEMLDQAVDSIAIKKITNILQRKSIELNQITFVISHRSEITEDNIFNNIIEVTKENGMSTINII